jgi:hypothetical protein
MFYILAILGILCFGTYMCIMANMLKNLIKAVESLKGAIESINVNVAPTSVSNNTMGTSTEYKFKGKKEVQDEFEQNLMKDLAQFEQPKEQVDIKLNLESKSQQVDNQAQSALDFLKNKKDKE